jgi:hypothetical protein
MHKVAPRSDPQDARCRRCCGHVWQRETEEEAEGTQCLSSLMQIARALDLELTLVPRTALAAVQALTTARRQEEPQLTSRIKLELARLRKDISALSRRYPKAQALERLTQTIAEVHALRFALPKQQAQEVLRAIDDFHEPLRGLRNVPPTKHVAARKLLLQIEGRERALRNIRNAIAHGKSAPTVAPTPAYQLGDGDEGDDDGNVNG